MVPVNALIELQDASARTDRESVHYGVPYSVRQPSAQQLAVWQSGKVTNAFHLPTPNQFIAEDVSLVNIEKDNPSAPALVLDEERKQIWYAQDEQFRLPRGATYINFRSPLVGQSAQQNASAVLYTALLKDQVNEYTYPALLAGLNFSLYKHAQGISLRISGYDDKQAVLLQELLQVMANPNFDSQRFDNIRKDMIRALENSVAKRPSSQVLDDLRESLLYGEWGEEPVIAALRGMQVEDLNAYVVNFWGSANAEAMIYGNYSPDSVQALARKLDLVLPDGVAPDLQPLKVLKIAEGESLLYPVQVEHDDAVLAWYLQGAGNSWKDRAATALTVQIMKSGFFQQLRTEQQLGYIVSTFAWPQLDVPGLVMLIQSPVADAAALSDAMSAFLGDVPLAVDEEQFQRHRDALINEVLRPHKNLWEQAELYWQSIAKKQYEFNGRQTMANAIKSLNREQWQAYFEEVFLNQQRSLQVAAPGARGQFPRGAGRSIESAVQLKSGHAVYDIE